MSGKSEKSILRNVIGIVIFLVLVVLLPSLLLTVCTRHNRYTTVPDMTQMTLEEAEAAAKEADIDVRVYDTIFVKEFRKGTVYSHQPKAGAAVKVGRTVDLVLNSTAARTVSVPNLCGMSVRQAVSELRARGLEAGRFTYRSDISTNIVLKQYYKGASVPAGTTLQTGSRIDLLLTINDEYSQTKVPDVKGQNWYKAVDILRDNCLNVPRVRFDSSVKTYSDSVSAVVYRQVPSALQSVRMGTEVSIYLRPTKKAE